MTTEIVKASKSVKANTSAVATHLDAVGRARELYLAQIKRAEMDYFERIERATELFTASGATPETGGNLMMTETPVPAPAPPTS
jgi:hypothetical protein